jgi:hypothetical protein
MSYLTSFIERYINYIYSYYNGRQIRHLTSLYCAWLKKRFTDSGAITPELMDP